MNVAKTMIVGKLNFLYVSSSELYKYSKNPKIYKNGTFKQKEKK